MNYNEYIMDTITRARLNEIDAQILQLQVERAKLLATCLKRYPLVDWELFQFKNMDINHIRFNADLMGKKLLEYSDGIVNIVTE